MGSLINRLRITLATEAGDWRVGYPEGPDSRLVTVLRHRGKSYPLPSGTGLNDDHSALLVEIEATLNGAGATARPALAQALLDALVDRHHLTELLSKEENEQGFLDLAIEFADASLASYPWELALGVEVDGKSLAAHGVTLTRLVTGGTSPQGLFARPVRILFVSGSPLDDPAVRPGAEFHVVTRAYAVAQRPFLTKLLVHATLDEFESAVESFRPQIVHFAGHGESKNGGFLEMRDPNPGQGKQEVTAAQLVAAMKAHRPGMLLLSACLTGKVAQPMGASEVGSLAEQFVRLGIPIVVGMAGRVTDLEARLFSRSIMSALAKGKPLIESVAHARQAAMQGPPGLAWPYLGLFTSDAVPVDFAPTDLPATTEEQALSERVAKMSREYRNEPTLCQRDRVWEYYLKVVGEGPERVLLLFGGSKMGKHRMICEAACQANREGLLTFLLNMEAPDDGRTGMRRMAQAMRVAVYNTAELYGIKARDPKALKAFAEGKVDGAALPAELTTPAGLFGLTARTLSLFFAYDIDQLRQELTAQGLAPANVRSVVLAEHFEKAPSEYLEALLARDGALTADGFGTSNYPIPFIASLDASERHKRKEFDQPPRFVKVLGLEPFERTNDADIFSYEQVLLHPFHLERTDAPDGSEKVFALAHDVLVEGRIAKKHQPFVEVMRKIMEGPLDKLKGHELYLFAQMGKEYGVMTESDEYTLLRAMGMMP